MLFRSGAHRAQVDAILLHRQHQPELAQALRRLSEHDLEETASTRLLVMAGRYVRLLPDGGMRPGRRTFFRWRQSYRRSLLLGSTPPHQATLIGPGARRRQPCYRDGFSLSADLDYFLRLSRWSDLQVLRSDLELVRMGDGGVSGQQTARRLAEVRRAYRETFGAIWPFAYGLRYAQRLLSRLAAAPATP